MNTPAAIDESPFVTHAGRGGVGAGGAAWLAGGAAVGLAGWLTRDWPAWVAMWAIAGTEFFAVKLATMHGHAGRARGGRIAGYLLAWPGMNARAFLGEHPTRDSTAPGRAELWSAFGKLVLGLGLAAWAVLHVGEARPVLVGWIGMLGIIFTLHFGLFHIASWFWRALGIDAPPIMHAPIAATSLAEFWGERWNVAFAESARRFIIRPLARRFGVRGAGLVVFAVSGLVHETVISWPARGGWGGPTLYFLLHAAGIAVEKSVLGRRLGLGGGVRGWLWTFLVTVAPLPLLFHAPFVRNVIVPFYRSLAAFLP